MKHAKTAFLISSLLCFLTATAGAKDSALSMPQVRDLSADHKTAEAETAITAALAKTTDPKDKEAWLFLQAWNDLQAGQSQKALDTCDELLKNKPLLEEEIRSMRAQALDQLGKPKEAMAEDHKLLAMAPNMRLVFDSNLRIARLSMGEGKYKQARPLLKALEKKARGTPQYADVVVELARAEKKFSGKTASCKWLRKLYIKNPTYSLVKDWGADLAKNEFDGQATGCANSKEDTRDRLRALLWSGEEDKARQEVEQLSQIMATSDPSGADEMRAWYLLQTGDPDSAFQILQGLYAGRKNNREFLMIYASAAARSGQGSAAVGAYHRAYQLFGKKSGARKALYESALLSFQFRDYDGASRKLNEFIRKYPRSGLVQDARWNLAWISYLKGNYEESLKRLKLAGGHSRAGILHERVRYWTAMSYLRLGEMDQARALFASIGEDKSGSYYGTAARQRLSRFPSPVAVTREETSPRVKTFGPSRTTEFLFASEEDSAADTVVSAEESESEETLAAAGPETSETADDNDDQASNDDNDDAPTVVLEAGGLNKNAANAVRFERAQALMKMGFTDEVRWELFEIEKRVHSKEDLQTLVAIYQQSGNFHRSANLAQLRFGNLKRNQNADGVQGFWQAAYPQAYKNDVMASAKENAIPSEFIWGIMRAESRYRKDAVSPVGALGLMQIMPGTARKLASLRQDKTFAPNKLLESDTAIHYGAFYLKRLSKMFDGSIPLTAAAYNAGPHRVHAWLLSFGKMDMDEFIEHIPFLETREYVRRVVANTLVYSNLYGNGGHGEIDLASPIQVQGRPEWSRKEIWE